MCFCVGRGAAPSDGSLLFQMSSRSAAVVLVSSARRRDRAFRRHLFRINNSLRLCTFHILRCTNITTIFFFFLQNHNAANIKAVYQVVCSSGTRPHLRLRCLRVLRRCAGGGPSVCSEGCYLLRQAPKSSPIPLCPLSRFPSTASVWKVEQSIPLAHHKQRTAEKVQTVPECWWKKKKRKSTASSCFDFFSPTHCDRLGALRVCLAKHTTLKFLELLKHE